MKNRVRESLDLPVIRRGNKINIKAHAEAHGFNPNYELPITASDSTHNDNFIQTLLFPDELQKRLRAIFSHYSEVINDKGLNVFYASFGLLNWFESDSSDVSFNSPLVLLPIEIKRKNLEKVTCMNFLQMEQRL